MNRITPGEGMLDRVFFFGFFVVFYGVLIAAGLYTQSAMGRSALDKQNLIGAVVTNPDGKTIGIINRVLTEKSDNAKFAVVVHSVLNSGHSGYLQFTPVPIPALGISEEMKSGNVNIVLNLGQGQLDAAPFLANIGNPKDDASVYKYYGLQPSWTENGMEKPMKEQKSEKSPYFEWEYLWP